MKARRHAAILQIIQEHPIQTQEELQEHLRRMGIRVTQATISRDLRELRLVKVPTGDGAYRYAVAGEPEPAERLERARRAIREYVTHVEACGQLVVIRTLSGTANAVAAALDALAWPEVIASLAGDDSILLVVRPQARRRHDPACRRVMEKLMALR